ncbi:energy transducer TonB [Kingella kingae]|uniref:energy transducer TonB n=1 Tax=Kingella kingae TaxID=504 RepID=UPI0002FBD98A|nr:energy transducer TonB [Kingella kingae]MCG9766716.1 energy transducer TonB [Vibrio alginolyticus]MDK4556128.1 energy transducer TonB [Kingella kingae]MDK4577329.1 energy transducer TonB [Kingella kingae]MDK4583340.1 energy transducer TonB [Kingella kingae]MDK4585308.1 energy transducer TonB [Kingella kingae]
MKQNIIIILLATIIGLLAYIAITIQPNQNQQNTESTKIINGGYIKEPNVMYPDKSVELGEEGKVKLAIIVNPNGSVDDIELIQSSGFERLDRAAIETVKQAKYQPKNVNGKPVRTRFVKEFSFVL